MIFLWIQIIFGSFIFIWNPKNGHYLYPPFPPPNKGDGLLTDREVTWGPIGFRVGQLSPNGTHPSLFQIRFQYILEWNLIWKRVGLFLFCPRSVSPGLRDLVEKVRFVLGCWFYCFTSKFTTLVDVLNNVCNIQTRQGYYND